MFLHSLSNSSISYLLNQKQESTLQTHWFSNLTTGTHYNLKSFHVPILNCKNKTTPLNIKQQNEIPKWPTNPVETSEVMGSAARANAAGNAIDRISIPSPSNLNSSLQSDNTINEIYQNK